MLSAIWWISGTTFTQLFKPTPVCMPPQLIQIQCYLLTEQCLTASTSKLSYCHYLIVVYYLLLILPFSKIVLILLFMYTLKKLLILTPRRLRKEDVELWDRLGFSETHFLISSCKNKWVNNCFYLLHINFHCLWLNIKILTKYARAFLVCVLLNFTILCNDYFFYEIIVEQKTFLLFIAEIFFY